MVFPSVAYSDFVEKVEKLGTKKRVRVSGHVDQNNPLVRSWGNCLSNLLVDCLRLARAAAESRLTCLCF